MQVSELIEDLRERARGFKTRLFPQQLLLTLDDTRMVGQPFVNGRPGPTCVDLPLPALTCKGGLPIEVEALADLIGELLLRENQIDAHVLAALPPDSVYWRVIDWVGAPQGEDAMLTLRRLQPDLGLPFPLAEAAIDLRPLPAAPGQWLLAATKREVVEGWITVFDQAGLRLERLAPPQSCRLAALREELADDSGSSLTLLLSPGGATNRKLMAIRAGVPLFERTLPLEEDAALRDVERCVAFLAREFAEAAEPRLLLEGPWPERERLETALGLAAQPVESEPYSSLVMKGLAIPEPTL